jgi:hypothetical protein
LIELVQTVVQGFIQTLVRTQILLRQNLKNDNLDE